MNIDRPEDQHDPGGKVKTKLADGIKGDAGFSACGRYRQWLSREWTPQGESPRTIMFCGMNPSTADAAASDPTVTREMIFARDWGFTKYLKVNVLDWRATKPADLPNDPMVACSEQNLHEIAKLASQSEQIILAYGRMHKRFQPAIAAVIDACSKSSVPIYCLGRNADGSAKHPLYLAKTTERIPF